MPFRARRLRNYHTINIAAYAYRDQKRTRARLPSLSLSLSIALAALPLTNRSASAVTAQEMVMALYLKIQKIVLPNGNDLKVGRSYFVIANPGVIVGDPADLVGSKNQEDLISVVDMTLKKDPFRSEGIFHFSQLYESTIDSMEVPHPPEESALLKQFHDLDDKRRTVFKTSYEEYARLRKALKIAEAEIDDYQTAQAELTKKDPASIPVTKRLLEARAQARQELKDSGSIADVAKNEDDISTIANKVPSIFKQRLRTQYADNMHGTSFPDYIFWPSPSKWGSAKWTGYSLKEDEMQSYSKDEFKSSSGGLGGDTSVFGGFLGGSVSTGKSESWKYSDVQATNMELKFDLARVGIFRPWFNPLILTSRRWRMPAAGELSCHVWSNGDFSKVYERELAPFYVKSIILSKNLEISGNWTKDIKKEYNLQSGGGGHVRFGFFSVGGNSSHSITEKSSTAKLTNTTIANPDVQILGFIVEPLGATPNPDPAQPWNSKAADCS